MDNIIKKLKKFNITKQREIEKEALKLCIQKNNVSLNFLFMLKEKSEILYWNSIKPYVSEVIKNQNKNTTNSLIKAQQIKKPQNLVYSITYHKNGNIKKKCSYKNEKLEGAYEEYTDDGKIKLKYFYKDGEKEGKFEKLAADGWHIIKGTLKSEKLEGICEVYLVDELRERTLYKGGIKNGESQEYYRSGNLKAKYFYNLGIKNGECRIYNDSGRLRIKYFYKNGVIEGSYKIFDVFGNVKIEYNYINGFAEGKHKIFNKKGKIIQENSLQNLKENFWLTKMYFANGNLKEISSKSEKGPYEKYYKNGNICIRGTYKDFVFDGAYEKYYENGVLKIKCIYNNGKLNGLYEEYTKEGKLKIKCNYLEGKLYGRYEKYDDKENVIKIINYSKL